MEQSVLGLSPGGLRAKEEGGAWGMGHALRWQMADGRWQVATPQDVGPFFRCNFISRGIGIKQKKRGFIPDPMPTPDCLGGAIARPHPHHTNLISAQ